MYILGFQSSLWLSAACMFEVILWSHGCGFTFNATSNIMENSSTASMNAEAASIVQEPFPGFAVSAHASPYARSFACDSPQKGLKNTAPFEGESRSSCGYDNPVENKIRSESRARQLVEGHEPSFGRSMRVKLKHRDTVISRIVQKRDSFREAILRDSARSHGLRKQVEAKKPTTAASNYAVSSKPDLRAQRMTLEGTHMIVESTVESGATLGAGEYVMDFKLGTPPRHFSLIIDTGSDLTWVQCSPCQSCYEQEGPVFDPLNSSSYKPISCAASECELVSSTPTREIANSPSSYCTLDTPQDCKYFYWYGDHSNTSGIFATETVTMSATNSTIFEIPKFQFGCGTANKGLFRGAGGLLGLGRGPLSFSSQLSSVFGSKFSYCLVDRDENMSVSSTIIFGEDKSLSSHPDLQYIPFAKTSRAPDLTFYFVNIKNVLVGGEILPIPTTVWEIDENGYGGTIFDSGTTLSYLAQPAYQVIKAAFESRVSYPTAANFMPDVLDLCYNISGIKDPVFPKLSIVFENDAVMHLPANNCFVTPDPEEEVTCLAILGAQPSSFSIIGNFQQQNFHIQYDRQNYRIGFAPTDCASVHAGLIVP